MAAKRLDLGRLDPRALGVLLNLADRGVEDVLLAPAGGGLLRVEAAGAGPLAPYAEGQEAAHRAGGEWREGARPGGVGEGAPAGLLEASRVEPGELLLMNTAAARRGMTNAVLAPSRRPGGLLEVFTLSAEPLAPAAPGHVAAHYEGGAWREGLRPAPPPGRPAD